MGLLPFLLLLFALSTIVTSNPNALNTNLFKKFQLFEQYAAASYCASNNGGVKRIQCAAGNCPLVEEAKPAKVMGLSASPQTDVNGFIAHDDINKATVISFRGSESLKNWEVDLDLKAVNVAVCQGCTATRGFWRSWNESRIAVLAAVNETVRASPEHRIVAVGHSLGASIATLATAELRNMGLVVDLYTFGSPRVGNAAFARMVENQSPRLGVNYRITHLNDPVPAVPPIPMGFSHIGPEYYIESKNKVLVDVDQIVVLNETDSVKGNGQWIRFDADAHGWYFNAISECYEEPKSAPQGLLESLGLAGPATGMFGGVGGGSSNPSPVQSSKPVPSATPSCPSPNASSMPSPIANLCGSLSSMFGIGRGGEKAKGGNPAQLEPWLQAALDQLENFKEHDKETHPKMVMARKKPVVANRGPRR